MEREIMRIIEVGNLPKEEIIRFFQTHWGSPQMVISSGVYDCSTLDGFAVVNDSNEVIGFITYVITGNECEIISLDSLVEGKGIGSALISEVEKIAKQNECKHVKVITTNDNLLALKFYQKRGFVLSKLLNNAVEKARLIKPQIPLIGNDGIPIRDEIVLTKELH